MKHLLILAALGTAPLPSAAPPPSIFASCQEAATLLQKDHASTAAAQADFRAAKDAASRCIGEGGGAEALAIRAHAEEQLDDNAGALADLNAALKLEPNTVGIHFDLGLLAVDMKDYDAAVTDFTAAIELDPDDADAVFERGWAYQLGGRNALAVKDFDTVVASFPTYAPVYRLRGLSYAALGRFDQAEADDTLYLAADPDDADTYFNRGLAREQLNNAKGAEEDFAVAISRDPKDADALRHRAKDREALKDFQGAIDDLTVAIALAPDAPSYNNRGTAYEHKGDVDAAIADYGRAFALNPADRIALVNRAFATFRQKKFADAISDFSEAFTLAPAEPHELRARAYAYSSTHDCAKAIADYSASLTAEPDSDLALYNRGVCHRALGQYDDAIADWTKASGLASNDGGAYFARADLYRFLGDYDKAAADYDSAISAAPADGRRLAARARLKDDLGDLGGAKADCTQAIALFDKAIAGNAKDWTPYYRRGIAHMACRDPMAAVADETQAIALEPANSFALHERAYAYWYAGQYDRAESDIDTALKRDTLDGRAYLELGLVKTDEKDFAGASRAYDMALAMPDQDRNIVMNGQCWLRGLFDRDLQTAEADCRTALEHQPKTLETRGALALVLYREGKLDEALQTLNAILDQVPRHAAALLLRSAVKTRLGQDGTADLQLGESLDAQLASRLKPFGILP